MTESVPPEDTIDLTAELARLERTLIPGCSRLRVRHAAVLRRWPAAEAEVVRLRQQIAGHCDRIAAQSMLLTQRAETQHDLGGES